MREGMARVTQAFDGIVTMTVDLGAELNAVAEGLARLVPPGGEVPSTATLSRSLHDVLRLHAAQVPTPAPPPTALFLLIACFSPPRVPSRVFAPPMVCARTCAGGCVCVCDWIFHVRARK